jgi:hypothetical protein
MRHVLTGLFCLAASLGLFAAEDPATLAQQLASSYGGHTGGDESPGFGDADLQSFAFQAADPKFIDHMKLNGGDARGAERVRIAVMWGYLRPHPDATEAVDWSGSITVTNAGLRVLRRLTFEDESAVVRPRTDIAVVEFNSQTRPHADGLLLDVVLAPSLNPAGGPVSLSLDMAAFSGAITIAPGMRATRVDRVDDAGHVVAYQIIRPDADGCAEGFVRGIWRSSRTDDGREVGVLKARVAVDDGRLRGHLRGVFGVRENGHQVWFAKMIDDEGRFLGIVAGRYGDGKLAGLLIAPGGKFRGVLRGRYSDVDSQNTRFSEVGLIGRYSERCGEDPREGVKATNDEPEIALGDDR